MSKRPGTIKNSYDINLSSRSIPSKNRLDDKFYYYYDLLWKDIDNYEE